MASFVVILQVCDRKEINRGALNSERERGGKGERGVKMMDDRRVNETKLCKWYVNMATEIRSLTIVVKCVRQHKQLIITIVY